MRDASAFRREAMNAYERGRLHAALRVGAVILPVAVVAAWETRTIAQTVALGLALWIVAVCARWRMRDGFATVTSGLQCGAVPLVAALALLCGQLYWSAMLLRRPGRRLVRWCAIALLLWTAADLAAPGLCAIEREQDATSASTAWTDGSTPLPTDQAPAQHVDDCFCCSHCVDVWRPAVSQAPIGIVEDIALLDQRATDRVPSPPYHPPLS